MAFINIFSETGFLSNKSELIDLSIVLIPRFVQLIQEKLEIRRQNLHSLGTTGQEVHTGLANL